VSTTTGGAFVYSGYKITAFPDRVDRQTPRIGYMPGHMPCHFGEKLEALGVEIVNNKADDSCHTDRKLGPAPARRQPTTSARWQPESSSTT
jgi:molecular chaperone Hsp31 and glyoxalase 3